MDRHLPEWYEWPLLAVFVPLILGGVLAGMALFRACKRCAMGSVYGEDGR